MSKRVLVLPGDGIGPEIVAEALKLLDRLVGEGLAIELDEGLVGGAAYDALGTPLPQATLDMAKEADGILGDFVIRNVQQPDLRRLRRRRIPGQRRQPGHPPGL